MIHSKAQADKQNGYAHFVVTAHAGTLPHHPRVDLVPEKAVPKGPTLHAVVPDPTPHDKSFARPPPVSQDPPTPGVAQTRTLPTTFTYSDAEQTPPKRVTVHGATSTDSYRNRLTTRAWTTRCLPRTLVGG